jgi:hypothetical protein
MQVRPKTCRFRFPPGNAVGTTWLSAPQGEVRIRLPPPRLPAQPERSSVPALLSRAYFESKCVFRKGECGRNYMCPGFESRRLHSRGRSSVGRAMFPLRNPACRIPLVSRPKDLEKCRRGPALEWNRRMPEELHRTHRSRVRIPAVRREPDRSSAVRAMGSVSLWGMARHTSLSPVSFMRDPIGIIGVNG